MQNATFPVHQTVPSMEVEQLFTNKISFPKCESDKSRDVKRYSSERKQNVESKLNL